MDLTQTESFNRLRSLLNSRAAKNGNRESAISGVWYYSSDEPYSERKSAVDSLAVAVVVQGQKTVEIGDVRMNYGPGDLLFLTRAQEFKAGVIEATKEKPYLSVGIVLPAEQVVETVMRMSANREFQTGNAASAVVISLDDRLVDAVVRLLQTESSPTDMKILAPLIRAEIIYLLLQTEVGTQLRNAALQNGDEKRIAEAISYIRSNYMQKLTVESISQQVAMSPSHFAHRFKDVARVSPMKYIKSVRLKSARQLLLADASSPSEVAYQVGYASPSHFSRDFKARFGLPPGEYRLQAESVS